MIIRIIDGPLNGSPVLLLPDGLLLRWPLEEPLPEPGSLFRGTTIQLKRPEQRLLLEKLLTGDPLERCDAAARLPIAMTTALYSRPRILNMRRVARKLTEGIRAHC